MYKNEPRKQRQSSGAGPGRGVWAWNLNSRLRSAEKSAVREAILGGGAEGFSRAEDRRWEVRVVDGVGEVLGLKAEEADAADHGREAEHAGVKLQAGFGGPRLKLATARGIVDPRGKTEQCVAGGPVDHEVVIVDRAGAELRGAGREAGGRGEIEGRAAHGRDFAGGKAAVVGDGIVGGGKGELVVGDVAAAAQIEEGVVGEVDRRGRIGRRLVIEAEGVVLSERVSDRDVEGAGVAFLAGRADE